MDAHLKKTFIKTRLESAWESFVPSPKCIEGVSLCFLLQVVEVTIALLSTVLWPAVLQDRVKGGGGGGVWVCGCGGVVVVQVVALFIIHEFKFNT